MTNFQAVLAQRIAAKKGKKNGFTLIELMVVVAIVGVLTAVGLPALTKAQDKAKDSAALATLTNAAKECSLELVTGKTTYTFDANGPFANVTSGEADNACVPDTTLALTSESGDGATTQATIEFTGAIPSAGVVGAI